MMRTVARKMNREEEGFTLIELMVVVLIIGILIAIALPTFLGARDRANNRAAQSNLRNALTAAKTYFTDNDVYTGFNGATIGKGIEPSLTWVDGASPAVGQVDVQVVSANTVQMVAQSASGTFYCIKDVSSGAGAGTYYGSGANFAAVDTTAECTGAQW